MVQTIMARRVLSRSSPCAKRRNPAGVGAWPQKHGQARGPSCHECRHRPSWEARKRSSRKKPLDWRSLI